MKYHKQIHFYKPENDEYGSCYPTVLACLLNLELDAVPNFNVLYGFMDNPVRNGNIKKVLNYKFCNGNFDTAGENSQSNWNHKYSLAMNCWHIVLELWLASKGVVEDWIPKDSINKWLEENRGKPYMVTGKSSRGVQHVVIYVDGKFHYDPHPANEDLIELSEEPYSYLKVID